MIVRSWDELDTYRGGLRVVDTIVKIAASSDDDALDAARQELIRRAFAASDAKKSLGSAEALEGAFGGFGADSLFGRAMQSTADSARGRGIRTEREVGSAKDAVRRAQKAKALGMIEGGDDLFRGAAVRTGAISEDDVGKRVGSAAQKMVGGHVDAIKSAAEKDRTKAIVEATNRSQELGLALRAKKLQEAQGKKSRAAGQAHANVVLGQGLRGLQTAKRNRHTRDVIEATNRSQALGLALRDKKRLEAAKAKELASAVSAGPPTPKSAAEFQDAVSAGPPTPKKDVYAKAKGSVADKATSMRDTLMGTLQKARTTAVAQAPVKAAAGGMGAAHAAKIDKGGRKALAQSLRTRAAALEEGKAPAEKRDDKQLASE